MLIVGERINATRKKIGEAVQAQDAEQIRRKAHRKAHPPVGALNLRPGLDSLLRVRPGWGKKRQHRLG